jgi:hypothetical protein
MSDGFSDPRIWKRIIIFQPLLLIHSKSKTKITHFLKYTEGNGRVELYTSDNTLVILPNVL